MYDDDVIDTTTSGEYRVRLIPDNDPEAPYDEGASPILYLAWDGWRYRADQVTSVTNYKVHDRIIDALQSWGDCEKFRRYCRAFHGVTAFRTYADRDGGEYLTLDPADWREKVGAPEGSISLREWIAYLECDTWGWIVERRETLESVWRNMAGEVTFASESEDWTEVGSCFGYYGSKYAEEAAREELAYYK